MTAMIDLNKHSVQILEKQQLTDRSVVIVKVDCGNMPAHRAKEYMENVKKTFEKVVEPAHTMVVPHTFSIQILEKEDIDGSN